MEGVLRILPNVVVVDGFFDLYLNQLEEHLGTNISQSEINIVCQTITSLLSTAENRKLGLKLLKNLLVWIPSDLLGSKINLWTSFLLKACNLKELELYGDLIYETLGLFAAVSLQPELSKNFATNYLSKIYEAIAISTKASSLPAVECAGEYLRHYSGPSGQSKSFLTNFFKTFVDIDDIALSRAVGRGWLLMQQVSGGGSKGVNHKIQWKQYQLQLLGSLNRILDQAFEKCIDFNEGSSNGLQTELELPQLNLKTEPAIRSAQLFVRFQNLTTYLEIALREPFSVSKSIMPKKVLDLINRGLSVMYSSLNRNALYNKIALGLFLPAIQLNLLSVLNVLIHTLRENLRSYYDIILSCLIHTLKSTSSQQNSESSKKPLKSLRSETYKSIVLWCQTLKDGSCCEFYAEDLLLEILKDIGRQKHDITLQVQITVQKGSKKSRRQFHTSNFEQSNRTDATKKDVFQRNAANLDEKLYIAALQCLQELVKSSCFLKPNLIRIMHTNILKLGTSLFATENTEFFNNWRCRLEVYKTLEMIILCPHSLCPPPMDIALFVFYKAQIRETNIKAREYCQNVILEIEKIVHPQKESLCFAIEARAIRNTFIKLGQERLLDEPLLAAGHFTDQSLIENSSDVIVNKTTAEFCDVEINNVIDLEVTETSNSVPEDDVKIAVNNEENLIIKSNEQEDNSNEEIFTFESRFINESKSNPSKRTSLPTDIEEDLSDGIKLCGPPIAKKLKQSSDENKEKVIPNLSNNLRLEEELLADMEAAFVNEFKAS